MKYKTWAICEITKIKTKISFVERWWKKIGRKKKRDNVILVTL